MDAIINFLTEQGLTLTTENVATSLSIMGQGMLGIFIVIAAITGVTTLLNTVTSGMGKKKDDDE